jgi:hypothetical protein
MLESSHISRTDSEPVCQIVETVDSCFPTEELHPLRISIPTYVH